MNFVSVNQKINRKMFPYVVFLFSVISILVFWKVMPESSKQNENKDYFYYYLPVGENIASGKGISFNEKIGLEYPPGYSVVIAGAIIVSKILHVNKDLVLQATIPLFIAISAVFIFSIAKMFFGPYRAFAAALLWCCYPLMLWAAKQQNSELPFMVFFYAAMYCFLHGWRFDKKRILFFILGGVFIGISMLIRPIAIGIGIIFAVVMLFWKAHSLRKRIVFAACILLGNIVAIIPWEAWVYHETKQVVMLCKGRDSFSMIDGLTFAVFSAGYREGVKVPSDVKEFMLQVLPEFENPPPAKKVYAMLLDNTLKKPVTMLKLFLIKAGRSWYGTNSNRLENAILALQLVLIVGLLFSVWSVWKKYPAHRGVVVILSILLCYFWGMTIMVLSIVRYMVPMIGLFIVFFPIGIERIITRKKN